MSVQPTGPTPAARPVLEMPCSRAAFLDHAASQGWRTVTCVHGFDAFSLCNIGCDDADMGLPLGEDGA